MQWYEIAAIYLLSASVVGLVPATLAKNKGYSFAAWWGVAVLLAGIFAVIPVALLPTSRCPHCREVIRPGANICPHCHARLAAATRGPIAAEPATNGDRIAYGVVVLLAVACAVIVAIAAFRNLPVGGAVALLVGVVGAYGVTLAVTAPQFFDLRPEADAQYAAAVSTESA